jgi:hypothetical protein
VREYVARVQPQPAPDPVVQFETAPARLAWVGEGHFLRSHADTINTAFLRISLEFDHPFRSKLITRFGRS